MLIMNGAAAPLSHIQDIVPGTDPEPGKFILIHHPITLSLRSSNVFGLPADFSRNIKKRFFLGGRGVSKAL
jgi:hypothetical protein